MSLKSVQQHLISHKNEINLPSEGATVFVGISGGVDSSVVAMLLKSMGYDVRGVFLVCWDPEYPGCTSNEDKKNAIKISSLLKIPLSVVDFRREYKSKVMTYMWSEYKSSRVPNPDVVCNREIKFGLLKEWVKNQDNDAWLGTGHYAKLYNNGLFTANSDKKPNSTTEKYGLYNSDLDIQNKVLSDNFADIPYRWECFSVGVACDKSKDQSYFLSQVKQESLSKTTFPLGVLKKDEVRNLTKELDMPNWNKKDSQGICFIGDVNMTDFIKKNVDLKNGDVVDLTMQVIGKHKGLPLYTLGQRHGLSINKYVSEPMYVIDKDEKNNQLIVGKRKSAYCDEFSIELANFSSYFDFLLQEKLFHKHRVQLFQGKVSQGTAGFCDAIEKEKLGLDKEIDLYIDAGVNFGIDKNMFIKEGADKENQNQKGKDNDKENGNKNEKDEEMDEYISIDDDFFGHGKKLTVRIRNQGSFLPCQLKIPFSKYNNHKTNTKPEHQKIYAESKRYSKQNNQDNHIKHDLSFDNIPKDVKVKLTSPEFGINPGQFAVFYLDDKIILSASIKTVNTEYRKRFRN